MRKTKPRERKIGILNAFCSYVPTDTKLSELHWATEALVPTRHVSWILHKTLNLLHPSNIFQFRAESLNTKTALLEEGAKHPH